MCPVALGVNGRGGRGMPAEPQEKERCCDPRPDLHRSPRMGSVWSRGLPALDTENPRTHAPPPAAAFSPPRYPIQSPVYVLFLVFVV